VSESSSADQKHMVFAHVHRRGTPPWEYEWIRFYIPVRSLHRALDDALKQPRVDRVIEVCWDPGYIT
jgi:hypothetical protein